MSKLDRAKVLGGIEELANLPVGWDQRKAERMTEDALTTARLVASRLPTDITGAPQVVPMSRGRLQFEWHRRLSDPNRSDRTLEIEFDDTDLLKILQYDGRYGFGDEEDVHWHDKAKIEELLRWFEGDEAI